MIPKTEGERRKARIFSFFLLTVCALALAPVATAQGLNDPTRPPAAVFSNAHEDTGGTAGPLLQSVMISPAGSSAIINGEIVKLGGKYGDARVVKITANEVVLRSANGTEILRMYPEVNMKAVGPAPAAGKERARKKRGPAADVRGKQG